MWVQSLDQLRATDLNTHSDVLLTSSFLNRVRPGLLQSEAQGFHLRHTVTVSNLKL